jgi:hypothetical protein
MGHRQKANFKKKLAAKRALKNTVKNLGSSEVPVSELVPQVISAKAPRQKHRRWTFYALVTMDCYVSDEGKIVETEENASRDDKGVAVKKPFVHKLSLSYFVLGDWAAARKQAVAIKADMAEQHKDAISIEVFPTGHETVSKELADQLSGFKQQNDLLQVALETMAEDYIAGKTPAHLEVANLKGSYFTAAFKKVYNLSDPPAPESQLVNADGTPMEAPPPEAAPAAEVTV